MLGLLLLVPAQGLVDGGRPVEHARCPARPGALPPSVRSRRGARARARARPPRASPPSGNGSAGPTRSRTMPRRARARPRRARRPAAPPRQRRARSALGPSLSVPSLWHVRGDPRAAGDARAISPTSSPAADARVSVSAATSSAAASWPERKSAMARSSRSPTAGSSSGPKLDRSLEELQRGVHVVASERTSPRPWRGARSARRRSCFVCSSRRPTSCRYRYACSTW